MMKKEEGFSLAALVIIILILVLAIGCTYVFELKKANLRILEKLK